MKQAKANSFVNRTQQSQQIPFHNNLRDNSTRRHHQMDGQYQNQIDYVLCSLRRRSSTWSAETRPGADCGSDHELLISKFRLKFKEVGKTTRPFRCNINQIPYDYPVEVTNRFKELDLMECLKNYVWRFLTLYRRW